MDSHGILYMWTFLLTLLISLKEQIFFNNSKSNWNPVDQITRPVNKRFITSGDHDSYHKLF